VKADLSRVVAHRGLSRIRPENTRSAVWAALQAGVPRIEIDVQLSLDGVPLLHHDADLLRMTGKAGDLRKMKFAAIRRLSCGEPGRFGSRFRTERPAALAELAEELEASSLKTLFVELKEESLRRFGRAFMLRAVAEALAPIRNRCVLISFDAEALALARETTRFPVGPVLRPSADARALAAGLKPEWMFVDKRLLPKQGALRARFGGARVCVYEVPDPVEARGLFARGIEAVETFRSDTLKEELELHR